MAKRRTAELLPLPLLLLRRCLYSGRLYAGRSPEGSDLRPGFFGKIVISRNYATKESRDEKTRQDKKTDDTLS